MSRVHVPVLYKPDITRSQAVNLDRVSNITKK